MIHFVQITESVRIILNPLGLAKVTFEVICLISVTLEQIMSNWNPRMGRAIMTSPVDTNTSVKAEKIRVKVGSACRDSTKNKPISKRVFGALESVTVEVVWDSHKMFRDSKYQHQTLNS